MRNANGTLGCPNRLSRENISIQFSLSVCAATKTTHCVYVHSFTEHICIPLPAKVAEVYIISRFIFFPLRRQTIIDQLVYEIFASGASYGLCSVSVSFSRRTKGPDLHKYFVATRRALNVGQQNIISFHLSLSDCSHNFDLCAR